MSGHLVLLNLATRRLGAQRTSRPSVQQVIIQETALDQVVELVSQGQTRINGVTGGTHTRRLVLVLTPCRPLSQVP